MLKFQNSRGNIQSKPHVALDYSMWNTIDCVYIIGHPEYEKQRIQYVIESLIKNGCPGAIIKNSCPTWGNTLSDETCLTVYDPYLPKGYPCVNFKCRWLLKGEISLVMNFYSAIKDAVQQGYQRIIVLESDVRLRHDFSERFKVVMEKANKVDWSYISLSDGVGTHSAEMSSYLWYQAQDLLKPNPNQKFAPFRCTDSMVFNRKFIEYLEKNLIPFRDCLDWELNSQLCNYKGEAWWAEPHLIEQATQKRMSASSLRV